MKQKPEEEFISVRSSSDYEFEESYRTTQYKFDFFFLAVIVGALSLSVQFFDPSDGSKSHLLMYWSWLSLGTSLFVGFIRQEGKMFVDFLSLNRLREKFDVSKLKQSLTKLERLSDRNEEQDELIKMSRELFEWDQEHENYLRRSKLITRILYHIQKTSFYIAILTFIFYKSTAISKLSNVYQVYIIFIVVVLLLVIEYAIWRLYKSDK